MADISSLDLASRLHISEILGEKELEISIIAEKCSSLINSEKLSRHLRHLCNLYIFREVGRDVFANNAVSVALNSEGTRAMIEHTYLAF
jgi:hypothetical protein